MAIYDQWLKNCKNHVWFKNFSKSCFYYGWANPHNHAMHLLLREDTSLKKLRLLTQFCTKSLVYIDV